MYNYGRTWNSFEAKHRCLDTEQYALHARGLGFDSPHLHHLNKHKKALGSYARGFYISCCLPIWVKFFEEVIFLILASKGMDIVGRWIGVEKEDLFVWLRRFERPLFDILSCAYESHRPHQGLLN